MKDREKKVGKEQQIWWKVLFMMFTVALSIGREVRQLKEPRQYLHKKGSSVTAEMQQTPNVKKQEMVERR